MKVYISADIEGIAGICHFNETNENEKEYSQFQKIMTDEVLAACNGAREAGANEILINDAHGSGRNILLEDLPKQARILRGWSEHPYFMMDALDSSFNAVVFIGYHAQAGSSGNNLCHTLNGKDIARITINDQPMSEFLVNTYTACLEKVPVIFLSGDQSLCEEAKLYDEKIETVPTLTGFGSASISYSPKLIEENIFKGVHQALSNISCFEAKALPKQFDVQINYYRTPVAFSKSFYPGCKLIDEKTISFQAHDYFEVLRMLKFTT